MQKSVTKELQNSIKIAFKEDQTLNDITSDLIIDPSAIANFKIILKEDAVVCGLETVTLCLKELAQSAKFKGLKFKIKLELRDGSFAKAGTVIASGSTTTLGILACERVMLNFIQHLSGIATLTKKFVDTLADPKIKILDTRKTLPGLRALQKYAVAVGGGSNHRFSLKDAILIKDNHVSAAGSISNALKKAKLKKRPIEIECENLSQVKEAIKFSPEVIMLDNMNVTQIKEAVKIIKGQTKIEVSGGINLSNIANFSKLKIDSISVGTLTHSARAIDISLEISQNV